jgi:hypothetical protein
MSKYMPNDGVTRPVKHGERAAQKADKAFEAAKSPEQRALNEERKAKLRADAQAYLAELAAKGN